MASIHSLGGAIPARPSRYGEISGAIGYCRILEQQGLSSDARHAAALDKIAAGLTGGINFSAFLDSSYGRSINKNGGHDWAFSVFHAFRSQPAVGIQFAPEIGRFLKDHALADVRKRVTFNADEATPGQPAAVESHWPQWYLFRGEYPPIGDYMDYISSIYPALSWHYGENHTATPDNAWALFMVHAYVYDEPGDTLLKVMDVPSCRGDLCHISRLTAALKGFGKKVWSVTDPGPFSSADLGVPAPLSLDARNAAALFSGSGKLLGRPVVGNPAAPDGHRAPGFPAGI
jgi:hypothetical protein